MILDDLAQLKGRVLFGWRMVGLAGMAHSINASAFNKGYVVFLLPVVEGLGVSRAAIALTPPISRVSNRRRFLGRFSTKPNWWR